MKQLESSAHHYQAPDYLNTVQQGALNRIAKIMEASDPNDTGNETIDFLFNEIGKIAPSDDLTIFLEIALIAAQNRCLVTARQRLNEPDTPIDMNDWNALVSDLAEDLKNGGYRAHDRLKNWFAENKLTLSMDFMEALNDKAKELGDENKQFLLDIAFAQFGAIREKYAHQILRGE